MPALVDLIDRYKNAHGVTDPELARRIGVTAEALRRWRTHGIRRLPQQANLDALARVLGQPYRVVLSAALRDAEYLTAEQSQEPRPHSEVLHDAIAVLSEATRLTNRPMRQTSSGGWEPNPDPRAALPIDWAEFVTHALAGAAANAGGIETVLSGRPGSWEAERVRQTLQSTVFDERDLLRYRTEPITIELWVEAILDDTADTTEDDHQAAELALSDRQSAVPMPDDIPPGPFRPDDPRIAEIDWVSVDNDGNLAVAQFAAFGVVADQVGHRTADVEHVVRIAEQALVAAVPRHQAHVRIDHADAGADVLQGRGEDLAVEAQLLASLVEHGQPPYLDKDGHAREQARLRWWNGAATTLADLAEISSTFTAADGTPYPALPAVEVERSHVYGDPVPVFYGHYWRQGSPRHLHDWTEYSACVDFSAVKGGALTAYRWSGEQRVNPENYVWVGSTAG